VINTAEPLDAGGSLLLILMLTRELYGWRGLVAWVDQRRWLAGVGGVEVDVG
jgi:hypothetical protein